MKFGCDSTKGGEIKNRTTDVPFTVKVIRFCDPLPTASVFICFFNYGPNETTKKKALDF